MYAETAHAAQAPLAPHTASALSPALSQAKLDANRASAKQSTGPRTPEGKARSSRNAVKSGLFCRDLEAVSAPLEDDRESLEALLDDLTATYQPETEEEALIVDRIVAGWWRLARLSAHGQRCLAQRLTDGAPTLDAILETEAIAPAEARIERSLSRLHRHLVSLQRYRRDRIRQSKQKAADSIEAAWLTEQAEIDAYLRSLRQQKRNERSDRQAARQFEHNDREVALNDQQAERSDQQAERSDQQPERSDQQTARIERQTTRHTGREHMPSDYASYAPTEPMEASETELELESKEPTAAERLIRSAA